jgi:hypothetical protein
MFELFLPTVLSVSHMNDSLLFSSQLLGANKEYYRYPTELILASSIGYGIGGLFRCNQSPDSIIILPKLTLNCSGPTLPVEDALSRDLTSRLHV